MVTEDAEAEEHEANLGQAEEEKNEANSDTPDFVASMEEENIVEPPSNDSFKIGSSNLSNSASLVSATGAVSPSLTSTTFEGMNSKVILPLLLLMFHWRLE